MSTPESASQSAPRANRLSEETSPYLLQHAGNPVDWYPWGEEALALAEKENRPIFLSIGYSACHWCHVMAHESFEDPGTAEIMNRHFVCIKVDREERPDLDHIYQSAYQLMTGRGGGWPLSMFLSPDTAPFWGGTYFPNVPRYGMPAFKEVLMGVARHFEEKPEDAVHNGAALTQGLARLNAHRPEEGAFSEERIADAADRLLSDYDPEWGGFGRAPKFPSTMALEVLLRYGHQNGDAAANKAVFHTLTKMANGGIYDHLGGGFARYSVDEKWLVPHFEKMLYDNALLVPLYVDAHRATGDPRYQQVVAETLDYVMTRMTQEEGGFYAAEDADSEGEEGRFYVWRPGEIEEVIGADAAPLFFNYYGVTEHGNFEGQNILWVQEPLADVAESFGMTEAQAAEKLAAARKALLTRRERRIPPGLDDKVIAGWNGLMLSAFAKAYEAFGDAAYRRAADRAADFLLDKLLVGGRLMRCYKAGQAKHAACLDDYVLLARGLIDLYRATGDAGRLTRAEALMETVLARFAAPDGGFYFTADDHEQLITRTLSGLDQSIPSGNGVAAQCLTALAHLTGRTAWLETAEATVRVFAGQAVAQPLGFSQILLAMGELLTPPKMVALVGAADDTELDAWHSRLTGAYRPHTLVQRMTPEQADAVPWLSGKDTVGGKAAAYLCEGGTCRPPVTDVEALEAML